MELSLVGRKVHEALWRSLDRPIRPAILETPAGFELNSPDVAGRYATFMRDRLSPYQPQPRVIAARKKGTPFSPDDPEICAPLLGANYFYLGAGSPSYTVRQLRGSLAWRYLMLRHRMGAPICFESAATVAVSRFSLPVYEIFKVGEDLHWKPGLDLLAQYGLAVSFVPHWNNTDGGASLDTTCCYLGRERFEKMLGMLPVSQTIVGIDDHTVLVVELSHRSCRVLGQGTVTVARDGIVTFAAGESFPLEALGEAVLPDPRDGVDRDLWEASLAALSAPAEPAVPDPAIQQLVDDRTAARSRRDWAKADRLRTVLAAAGWWVDDTPAGPVPRRREAATGDKPPIIPS